MAEMKSDISNPAGRRFRHGILEMRPQRFSIARRHEQNSEMYNAAALDSSRNAARACNALILVNQKPKHPLRRVSASSNLAWHERRTASGHAHARRA